MKRFVLFVLFVSTTTLAQEGDKKDSAGEVQRPPRPEWVQPAPPLSPEDELKTFKLTPGFHVELVAAEPLVVAPVAAAFDASGRLWVAEMRDYMPNVDAKGEDQLNGRIVILESLRGDGRYDKSTVFADGLFLPRAVLPVRDGALVAETPNLWFCRERDGKCVEKTLVANDYGARGNPEHTANGLLWALDNWIYSADATMRFRWDGEKFQRDAQPFGGQWGLTMDDFGRLFYNSNEDQLRGDLVPCYDTQYFRRNPHYRSASGLNVQIARDQTVWPAHPTPGVNRGYRKGILRDDGTLEKFTAACAPCVYRGQLFPDEFRGNIFVCEPAANLVHRNILVESGLTLTAKSDGSRAEFFAGRDERFRPVNLLSGPDGALYVLDMYRGVLEHRLFVTSYIRKQIIERGLESPLDRGRIWRIVPDGKTPDKIPNLARLKSAELVAQLSSPNGWVRDTAQRLLVERQDKSVAPALTKLLDKDKPDAPSPRLHALWTLDGLNQLDKKTLQSWLCSRDLNGALAEINAAFMSEESAAKILNERGDNALIRDAVFSGLAGRELETISRVDPKQKLVLGRLAACVIAEGDPTRITRLLDLVETRDAETQIVLLGGILDELTPAQGKATKKISFDAEPSSLAALAQAQEKTVRERAQKIASLVTWKGKSEAVAQKPATAKPLTAEQRAMFEQGKPLFKATCAQCHMETGAGLEGKGTPLLNSEWANGSEQRVVRIVLNGLKGPITVQGVKYEMEMPAWKTAFDAQQIAAVLTYVRREWGHTADPVAPATVAQIRKTTEAREEPWTEKELKGIK